LSCARRPVEVPELLAAIIRALGFAAGLSGAGAVLARHTLMRDLPAPDPAVLIRIAGAVLAVIACCTGILIFERLGRSFELAILGAIFLSPLGAALLLQIAGGLGLIAAARRPVAIVAGVLILLSFGVVGHSATRGWLTSLSVVLHVSAAAWWLGGLWILLLASRKVPAATFAGLVRRFSHQAALVVAILLLAAAVTAVLLLEYRFDWSDTYTRGLLGKVGLTLVLLALAGINRFILTPRLAAGTRSVRKLRWAILAELALFGCILSLTAWLTTSQSPPEPTLSPPLHEQMDGPIVIAEPWAPSMLAGVETGAGYMTIINQQQVGDRLLAASSPWAETVTLHMTQTTGEVSRMRELTGIPIPAGGRVVMEPGVYHLMFSGLITPFVAGDDIPVTLVFDKAGKVDALFRVHSFDDLPEHLH